MCIRIQSRDFGVADHRAVLEAFGNSSYCYQGQELFVRYTGWNDPGTLILSDHADAEDVRLTPRLCGSFAIWPENGGGWDHDADYCMASSRGEIDPDDRINSLGFRLAAGRMAREEQEAAERKAREVREAAERKAREEREAAEHGHRPIV